MNFFGVMQISSSALSAEGARTEVVAANMANAETTRSEDGTPYRRQNVLPRTGPGRRLSGAMSSFGVSAPAGSVEVAGVVASDAPALRRYDPSHPDADGDGYISCPDIHPVTEMVNLMGASRSYGLNASAVQAEKGTLTASLDILK